MTSHGRAFFRFQRAGAMALFTFAAGACSGRAADPVERVSGLTASCPGGNGAQKFAWPLPGSDTHEWVINNYVDDDPTPGVLDYTGRTGAEAETYDGHTGVDIDVADFRSMDNDFPILAGADGSVVGIESGQPDRNTSCTTNDWNYVAIAHASGYTSYYGHLKKDSVVVRVGDHVTAGQKVGVVGSSGCSSGPHLHFEVHDADNKVVDPFGKGMFCDPPAYDPPLGFMAGSLHNGALSDRAQVQDPGPDITTIAPGSTVGLGLSTGGGKTGDALEVTFRRPDGTVYGAHTINYTSAGRHSDWFVNWPLGTDIGRWSVEIATDGTLAHVFTLDVSP